MKKAVDILNEKNPILREIWTQGYDYIKEDYCSNTITLIDCENKFTKVIDRFDWKNVIYGLNFKTSILYSGECHTWIKESDGSANRLRKIISRDN